MDLSKVTLNGIIKRISMTALLPFFLAACSKGGGGADAGSSVEQGLSCPTGLSQKAGGEDLAIQSKAAADVGEVVQYQLSNDALCSGAQKVVWDMPGAQQVLAKAGSVSARYSAPGDYYVSAKLVGSSSTADIVQQTLIMGEQIQFSGPQITTEYRENTFSLSVPSGSSLNSVEWIFGDGQTVTTTERSVTHAYVAAGEYAMVIHATDNQGVVTTIEHHITVLVDSDELFCATQLLVSVPSETRVGDSNTMSIFLPSCLRSYLTGVDWDFGDGSNGTGDRTEKIYTQAGDYTVRATIRLNYVSASQIRVTKRIQVNEGPVDNNKCTTLGQRRDSYSANYDEVESCGINGKKTVTYRDHKTEECQRVDSILDWVLTSTVKEKVGEGPCQGQACPLPGNVPTGLPGVIMINGQAHLVNGGSLTFYTQSSPGNSCEQNKEVRSCSNGTLSGSSSAIHYQCQSGCGDFGPNGTVKTDINIGTQQVPVQCAFGEQGIFDIYGKLEDRSCTDGTVNSYNQRLGDLISKGLCPTYSYHSTGLYTACTADCGGTQSLIYECRNNLGEKVSNDRCAGQTPPVQTRLCDRNPEAVRRTEVSSEAEQVNSDKRCPKNQIGIIINNREAITTKTYACIDHAVKLESTKVDYTPWVEENYCRDYVAHRCSNDSLSNTQAHGRYLWMVKCQNESPIIKEFLENFDDVTVGYGIGIDSSRSLYPTFLDRAYSPERVWKAPTTSTASCYVPPKAYIAAVCVSSCAIPQEQIVAQVNSAQKASPVAFIEALTKNYSRVSTLHRGSSLDSRQLKSSKVEQWVTELLDTEQPVLVFKMESGKTLSVTPNHPLMKPDGRMDTADQFKVGESLVRLGGAKDPIVEIESILHYGKVYNLFVKSSVPEENIVVTNGYLNGSAFFQNEGAGHMNKKLLRRKLTQGVFNK